MPSFVLGDDLCISMHLSYPMDQEKEKRTEEVEERRKEEERYSVCVCVCMCVIVGQEVVVWGEAASSSAVQAAGVGQLIS